MFSFKCVSDLKNVCFLVFVADGLTNLYCICICTYLLLNKYEVFLEIFIYDMQR